MNDSHVSPVSINKVLSAEAYILFYSKVSTSPPKQIESAVNGKDLAKEKVKEDTKVEIKPKFEVKGVEEKKATAIITSAEPMKIEKIVEHVRPRSLSEDSSKMHHVPAVYTSLLINDDEMEANDDPSVSLIDEYGRLRKPKPWVFMLPMRYC
jgi:hypothetical protein